MERRFSRLVLIALAALCASAGPLPALSPKDQEARANVVAAFLYNFLLFTEWPPDPVLDQGPFVIGVLGRNPFERAAAAIERRSVANRPIVFRHFRNLANLEPSHVLFVADPESADMDDLLKAVGNKSVLLVGDSPAFTRQGGTIRFYDESAGGESSLRVEINKTAADRAGIRFRSQLLRLAQVVEHPAPGEP